MSTSEIRYTLNMLGQQGRDLIREGTIASLELAADVIDLLKKYDTGQEFLSRYNLTGDQAAGLVDGYLQLTFTRIDGGPLRSETVEALTAELHRPLSLQFGPLPDPAVHHAGVKATLLFATRVPSMSTADEVMGNLANIAGVRITLSDGIVAYQPAFYRDGDFSGEPQATLPTPRPVEELLAEAGVVDDDGQSQLELAGTDRDGEEKRPELPVQPIDPTILDPDSQIAITVTPRSNPNRFDEHRLLAVGSVAAANLATRVGTVELAEHRLVSAQHGQQPYGQLVFNVTEPTGDVTAAQLASGEIPWGGTTDIPGAGNVTARAATFGGDRQPQPA